MLPSSGSARQVSGSSRTGASGKAVCQPVKLTLSYCWSFESQPSTTSQKPRPFSRAEKNLSRSMYLPRRMPSLSKTADLDVAEPALLDDRAGVRGGAYFFWLHETFAPQADMLLRW